MKQKYQDQPSSTLITQIPTNTNPFGITSKKYQVYMVQDSVPPLQFLPNDQYTPLPSTVRQCDNFTLHQLLQTVVALKVANKSSRDTGNDNIIQKWTKYLNFQENRALVSDCFWFAICKFFHQGKYQYSQSQLQKRIAKNYIGLFLSVQDKKQSDVFFKQYFNTLAQSVFYSFFYAFPKSRSKFDNSLKEKLVTTFSKIFTGVQISNKKHYYQKWTLDLGTGNILARKNKKQAIQQVSKPTQYKSFLGKGFQKMKKRQILPIRYSPIVQLYLKTNKYKTRNYVSQFKMKYTQVDKNDNIKQQKFAYYKQEAKRIQQWSEAQKNEDEAKRRQLDSQIKALKRQTINHHKRLDRRKAQQLQRGAHQYANYLVSMLNAGITMTSLGVVRKNVG